MGPGRCFLIGWVIFLAAFSVPALKAQQEAYLLGKGDVITLTVYLGGNEEQKTTLTVSDQGIINVPLLGLMKARGLTLRALEKQIRAPLAKDYYVNPQVNIRIDEYHSLHYSVSGAVNSPGMFEMTSQASVLDLIAKAGGITEECAHWAYVLSAEKGQLPGNPGADGLQAAHEPERIDLKALLEKGDMRHNRILKPGDVLYFPPKRSRDVAESKIYIEGEVGSPGAYDFQEGITALSACIMAGGFKEFAAPNRTRIIRQNGAEVEVIKINLNQVQKGKTADPKLQPGDRIHIPESWL